MNLLTKATKTGMLFLWTSTFRKVMMTDKTQQFISDKWQLSRHSLEIAYGKKFTDNQWRILCEYCGEIEDETEFDQEVDEIISTIEQVEKFDTSYRQRLIDKHGKTWEEIKSEASND